MQLERPLLPDPPTSHPGTRQGFRGTRRMPVSSARRAVRGRVTTQSGAKQRRRRTHSGAATCRALASRPTAAPGSMRGRLLGRGSRSQIAVPKQRTTCPLKGASTARKHGTDQWERGSSVNHASPRWRCLPWRQIRFRLASFNWLTPSDCRTAAPSSTTPQTQRARANYPLPPPLRSEPTTVHGFGFTAVDAAS